jgi:transcriptional regulator with XRE-family HTH domain
MTETKEIKTQNKEYLTQKEHAARLGVSRQTISANQRKYNLFRTISIGKNLGYVWVDGEPQYNEKKEDNHNE